MSTIEINGDCFLNGEVKISGSKNAALCLIAASVALRKKTILKNIPNLTDIKNFIAILKKLNVVCLFENNDLVIDATNIEYKPLTFAEVSKFRASYYLIGALLPYFKHLEINYPGGCDFVKRPIDIHLKVFEDFGVKYKENTCLNFVFEKYENYRVSLKSVSFGATVNAILMGLSTRETVIIDNTSQECEIDCLIEFLKRVGVKICRKGKKIIMKAKEFKEVEFSNIPDRMEIGTFAFLAASKGKIKIYPIIREHVKYLESIFKTLDITYYFVENALVVEKSKVKKSLIIETGEYPLFPTDLQPILSAYLTTIKRIHVIRENIYNQRFSHVEELKKMGASIFYEGNTLLINGIFSLHGKTVEAHDLRCGAAILVAGFNAEGKTIIENGEIINRGYERIIEKLKSLGANIEVKE